MLVSGVPQNDSVICVYVYMCVYILLQVLFPYRLLQNVECSSLCYTVGTHWLSILYIAVCICWGSQVMEQSRIPLPVQVTQV